MKKIIFLGLFSFLALMLIGCSHTTIYKCPQGMKVSLPKCTKLIKYDAGKLNVGAVSITIPSAGTTVSVGNVTWNREKLQSATNAAMMLDNQNYQRCQNLPTILSVCKTDDECRNVVNDYDNRTEIMNQFAMIIEANYPKGMDRWLNMYFTKHSQVALVTTNEKSEIKKSKIQYVLKKNVKAKSRQLLLK